MTFSLPKSILCAIPLHYGKNKSCAVPRDGECKQICVKNGNKQALT